MTTRIYVRASTKDQDATRALADLKQFSTQLGHATVEYVENHTGTKLDRPVLNTLLADAEAGDLLLVESVDRLSRLTQQDFDTLKQRIKDKGLRLVVADLPTTHPISTVNTDTDTITGSIMQLVNNLLIDMLATMARLDNDKRVERIKQGLANSTYKATGKKINKEQYDKIKKLLDKHPTATKDEVAAMAGCGVATVFRAIKYFKQQ